MYYLFTKEGRCFASSSGEVNEDDLKSREEFTVFNDKLFEINNISYDLEGKKIVVLSENDETLALKEHQWVISEIEKAQISLMYFWTKDIKRQTYTEQVWLDYIIALRNYTTTDENGDIKVTSEVRPVVEDFIPKVDDQPDDLVEDGKVTGTDIIIIYEELNSPVEEV